MLSLGTLNIAVPLSSECLGIIYYTLYALKGTMILDCPNDLVEYQSFWMGSSLVGPSHFGQVLIIKIIPEKSNLNLTQTIWTIQNHFGPTEGTSHQVL